jgi:phosphoenolpyruvate carboxykinase (GTP)
LPDVVRAFIEEKARICQPDNIHICDGSADENKGLLQNLAASGVVQKLESMDNCWLALTDPKDVARVESRTFISTPVPIETLSVPSHGFTDGSPDLNLRGLKCSALGNWMSPADLEYELGRRLPGCMKGRTMYVIPYSMGPIGGPISKVGIELTDSAYVVCNMRIMTRMGVHVLKEIEDHHIFVKCLHTVSVYVYLFLNIHRNSYSCDIKNIFFLFR